MSRSTLLVLVTLFGLAVGTRAASADSLAGDSEILRAQRPDPVGVPTPVAVRAFLADVINIDNVMQEFTADVYFRVTWKDSRLAGATVRKLALTDVWHPNLTVLNERNLDDLMPDVVTVESDGTVTYTQRSIGTFAARMDLREFPHDRQTLLISVISVGFTPEEIALRPANEFTEGFEAFSISDWHLTLQRSVAKAIVIPSTGERRPGVDFAIEAERDTGYYLWVMYLPLAFIVFMAWMVFWIDPSLIPSQIAISTASVFSLIAFRFSIRLSLPAVSYMTRMDEFVLGCTVLVFLALGQAVMTARLAKQGQEALARKMDHWGRWIYVAGFALIFIMYR